MPSLRGSGLIQQKLRTPAKNPPGFLPDQDKLPSNQHAVSGGFPLGAFSV
jgi:hypothetical protein